MGSPFSDKVLIIQIFFDFTKSSHKSSIGKVTKKAPIRQWMSAWFFCRRFYIALKLSCVTFLFSPAAFCFSSLVYFAKTFFLLKKSLGFCPQSLLSLFSRLQQCYPYLKHGSRSIIRPSATPKCAEAVTLQRWNSRSSSHRMSLRLWNYLCKCCKADKVKIYSRVLIIRRFMEIQ